jgi:hypothetical protein
MRLFEGNLNCIGYFYMIERLPQIFKRLWHLEDCTILAVALVGYECRRSKNYAECYTEDDRIDIVGNDYFIATGLTIRAHMPPHTIRKTPEKDLIALYILS